MTTKKELLKQIEELQKKADAMPDDGGFWIPKEGDQYWFVDVEGRIRQNEWVDDSIDQNLLAFSNIYQTFRQAETARDRRFAEVRVLRRIAELNAKQGWTARFDGKQDNYFIDIKRGGGMDFNSYRAYQALPIEYYGSKRTIKTVMTVMKDDYQLMLGVISNE